MDFEKPLPRRTFFRISSAAVVTAGIFGSGCTLERRRWRFFTEREAALVDDISERIIPADQDPGGRFAGVVNFIDRQLAGPYSRYGMVYRESLAKLEQTARARFGAEWAALTAEQQTEVLAALEKEDVPGEVWEKGRAAAFFGLLRDHCLQGYYGPPRHGGNRDYVSYRMLGLAYPQIVGRGRHA